MTPTWPRASDLDSATPGARHRMAALELVDQANWYVPHRHKADGSYWRLDADDKYQQRFLIRVDEHSAWATFDSRPLEKALQLEARGGLTEAA